MKDRDFLVWIHERLEHVHKDDPHTDFMHKLRAVIKSVPENKETLNIGTFNSLEELIDYLGRQPK